MVCLIIVDSNVWVFLNVENYPEHDAAINAVKTASSVGMVTNVIIGSEVFHTLSAILGKGEARLRMEKLIDSESVVFVPIDSPTLRRAIALAERSEIRINDAVIAQQALEMGIPLLTDNVKDFKKVHGLKIVPLRGRDA